MKATLFATSMVAALAFAGVAAAATTSADAPVGKQAGTFMVRARLIDVIPENNGSSTSVGGHVTATDQFAPEVDFSYFFTDHIAAELIAATTRHNVAAKDTAVGHVDVGSVWALPPTITLQYHFRPHERFSPYVGAGVNATFFYASKPAGPTVTKFTMTNTMGEAIQAGFDYNVSGHWFVNADVKQIFMHTKARLHTVLGNVTAKTNLDPIVVGVGVGYRF